MLDSPIRLGKWVLLSGVTFRGSAEYFPESKGKSQTCVVKTQFFIWGPDMLSISDVVFVLKTYSLILKFLGV